MDGTAFANQLVPLPCHCVANILDPGKELGSFVLTPKNFKQMCTNYKKIVYMHFWPIIVIMFLINEFIYESLCINSLILYCHGIIDNNT